MLFNSFGFLVFLPLVFLGYWWLCGKNRRAQNLLIIGASYLFYGWWDWRYLILLFISSFTDYWLGIYIDSNEDAVKRKRALYLSLVFNLGILGFFKYFNFFVDSAADLLTLLGFQPNIWSLRVILPIGISFYTFQSLSYTIEAYRRNFKPERDLGAYLAFVSFFPHMVAGPIMRAIDLLPQFQRDRVFDLAKARDGMRQMLWGFFKKIVIADQCAPLVDKIFDMDRGTTPGITLLAGAVFFAFQIYGDFSGYSDIAIGCARLFGIELMQNFNQPYFSRSIGEFWRRWHISLSTWFRDFVYIPLGGSRKGRWRHLLNLMVTFTVSGFWHGANWTFVVWGALNGAYYVPEVLSGSAQPVGNARLKDVPRILFTFLVVSITWIFFRSVDLVSAISHVAHIFLNATYSAGAAALWLLEPVTGMIILMLLAEWATRHKPHPSSGITWPLAVRWLVYLVVAFTIAMHIDPTKQNEFIYFQF